MTYGPVTSTWEPVAGARYWPSSARSKCTSPSSSRRTLSTVPVTVAQRSTTCNRYGWYTLARGSARQAGDVAVAAAGNGNVVGVTPGDTATSSASPEPRSPSRDDVVAPDVDVPFRSPL